MRASARFIVGALMLGGTACDHPSSVPTPAAPAPISPTVASVTINGVPASLTVGQTVQLTASVTLSDGTRSDATTQAAWQSSDVTVATVSSAGLLAIAAPGDADVTATLQTVQGRAHVSVPKPIPPRTGFDITGVVHESAPTEGVALSGATVGIHFVGCPSCRNDNETTTTGADGRFTLPGIETGGFTLWATKPGYETTPFNVAQLPRDQHPDIGLTPELAMVPESHDFIFQASDCRPGDSCHRDIPFGVHHQGEIVVRECESAYTTGNCCWVVRLIRQGRNLAERTCLAGAAGWSWPVEAGFVYTVRASGEGNHRFHMVFAHPN